MLEPVAELVDVVGYRSLNTRPPSPRLGAPRMGHGTITNRFAELLAARRASAALDAIDAARWLDEGGHFDGAAARPEL
jgi:hypothetical protein